MKVRAFRGSIGDSGVAVSYGMDEWAVRFHPVEFRRQYGFDERAFFVKALRRAGFS